MPTDNDPSYTSLFRRAEQLEEIKATFEIDSCNRESFLEHYGREDDSDSEADVLHEPEYLFLIVVCDVHT